MTHHKREWYTCDNCGAEADASMTGGTGYPPRGWENRAPTGDLCRECVLEADEAMRTAREVALARRRATSGVQI